MKLGDFFIQLGVKGDTKKLNETIKQLEEAEKATRRQIKYQQDLAKAETEEQKALIRKNYYQNKALDNAKKQKTALENQSKAMSGVVKGIGAFVAGVTIAYTAVDRMVNSLASANARMIAFQRQTGISFASLNKYASASAMVNYNSTPEQVANTMQTLAQNLFDIRMGRGDISPYQELSFVGGKSFNPLGMTVEQLIESVREAIKGVNDVQATNIITRMGFSPDDLLMLRMSREEFEKINDLFLNPKEREQMNAYALQIKKMRLEMTLFKDRALLAIMPIFVKITEKLKTLSEVWGKIFTDIVSNTPLIESAIKGIGIALMGVMIAVKPLFGWLTMLYLVLEDIAYWYAGKGSLFGDIFGERGSEKYKNSAMGKTTDTLGKGFKTISKIVEGYQAIREGKLTGDEANQMVKDFLDEKILKKGIEPSTSNIANTNNSINQNNNIVVNTNEAGDYIIDTVNNMSIPLRQAVTPIGY
jgi:hypothetical protein